MTGEPISTALLVASAASTGAGIMSSGQQKKIEMSRIQTETEAAKLQATEEAFAGAQSFRQALSSQLALSSLRSGAGGSLVRQFGATSISNMFADQGNFERRKSFIDMSASISRANASTARFSSGLSSIGGLLSQGLQSVNLSAMTNQAKVKAK